MRICNGCDLCCHAVAISELDKPRHTGCQYICAEGCSIHEIKPYVCETVSCLWLQGQFFNQDWPSTSGFAVLDKGLFYIGFNYKVAVVHEDSRRIIAEDERRAFIARVHTAGWPIVLLNSQISEDMIVYIDTNAPGIMPLVFGLEQGGNTVVRMAMSAAA